MALLPIIAVEGATLVNHATGDVVAQITDSGMLDVKRPSGLPRPHVKTTADNLVAHFAKWYTYDMHKAEPTPAEVSAELGLEGYDKHPTIPEADTRAFQAFEHAHGDDTLIIVAAGKHIIRVGLLRERSVKWAFSPKFKEARPAAWGGFYKASTLSEIWRLLSRSFTGSFSSKPAAQKVEKTEKAPKPKVTAKTEKAEPVVAAKGERPRKGQLAKTPAGPAPKALPKKIPAKK